MLMTNPLRKGREVAQPLRIKRDQEIAIGKRIGVGPGLDPIRRERPDTLQGLLDQKAVGREKHHMRSSLIHN